MANSSRRSRTSEAASGKKTKKSRPPVGEEVGPPPDGIYSFHPEDDVLVKGATHSVTYPFVAPLPPLVQETRGRDSFGLDVRGRVMLVPGGGETLRELGQAMSRVYGSG